MENHIINLPDEARFITGLTFDNRFLFISDINRNVFQVDLESKKVTKSINVGKFKSECSQGMIFGDLPFLLIDETQLYALNDMDTIRVYSKDSLEQVGTIGINVRTTKSWWIDERYLYAGSYEYNLCVWDKMKFNVEHDLIDGEDYSTFYPIMIQSLKGHSQDIRGIIVEQADDRIYSWSDSEIIVWDRHNYAAVETILDSNPQKKKQILKKIKKNLQPKEGEEFGTHNYEVAKNCSLIHGFKPDSVGIRKICWVKNQLIISY